MDVSFGLQLLPGIAKQEEDLEVGLCGPPELLLSHSDAGSYVILSVRHCAEHPPRPTPGIASFILTLRLSSYT